MPDCCDPSGYRRFFNTKEAKRAARSYERRGLDATARRMVDALGERLDGATVLEAGSGTGASHVEMLKRGARRAIAVDLSDAYLPAAEAIAANQGVEARVERHVGDFVALAPSLPEADVVYLNRVVCCYPDMPGMLDASVDRAGSLIALSFPRNRWLTRLGFRILNAFLRWRSVGFQVYVHDPAAIDGRLRAAGFVPLERGRTLLWHWDVWERAA